MGDVRGVGFWENSKGGVRQMGEGGSKKVGSERNYGLKGKME